jgi:hypothetical protein
MSTILGNSFSFLTISDNKIPSLIDHVDPLAKIPPLFKNVEPLSLVNLLALRKPFFGFGLSRFLQLQHMQFTHFLCSFTHVHLAFLQ